MIRIAVRLYASLRSYGPELPVGSPFMVEIDEGATLGDLVARLCIPVVEVRLAFANGRKQEMDAVLRAGDEVALFPPIAGGTGHVRPRWDFPSGHGWGHGRPERDLFNASTC